MANIGRIISSSPRVDEVYEQFASTVAQLIPFDRLTIATVDMDAGVWYQAYVSGMSNKGADAGASGPLAGSVTGRVIAARRGIVACGADRDRLLAREPELRGIRHSEFRSMISVPLISGDHPVGLLSFRAFRPDAYLKTDLQTAQLIADQIAGAIANAELYKRVTSAHTRLRESQSEYQALFEEAPVAFLLIDSNGLIEHANLRAATLFALEAHQLVGRNIRDFTADTVTNQERVDALFDAFRRGQVVENQELEGRRFDGSPLWINVNVHPAPEGEDGGLQGRVAVVDISARKSAEDALAKQINEERAMAKIGMVVSSSLDLQDVFEQFAQEVRTVVDCDRLVIAAADLKEGTVTDVYNWGVQIPEWRLGLRHPFEGSTTGRVMKSGVPFLATAETPASLAREYPELANSVDAALSSMLSVPLTNRGETIGALHLRSRKPHAYTDRDIRLVERVAAQIAGAIVNAQLHESVKRDLAERQMLTEIGRIANSTVDVGSGFPEIATRLQELIPYDGIELIRVDRSAGTFAVLQTFGVSLEGREQGTTHAVNPRRYPTTKAGKVRIDFDSDDLEGLISPDQLTKAGLRSSAVASTSFESNTTYALCFFSKRVDAFDSGHRELANRVVAQLAGPVANAELYWLTRRESDERAAIATIGLAVNSSSDLERIYSLVADQLEHLIPSDRMVITRQLPNSPQIEFVLTRGISIGGHRPGDRILPAAAMFLDVANRDGAILFGSADEWKNEVHDPTMQDSGLQSWLEAPLGQAENPIGYISLRSLRRNAYSERDLDLLRRVAAQVAPALQNAQLLAQLHESARLAAAREEQLRRVLDSTQDAFLVLDQDGTVILASAAVQDVFGRDRAAFENDNFLDWIGPSARVWLQRELSRPHEEASAETRRAEVDALRGDGTQFAVEISLSAVQGPDEHLFFAVVRDITKEKVAEAQEQLHVRTLEAFHRIAQILGGPSGFRSRVNDVLVEIVQVAEASVAFLAVPDGHTRDLYMSAGEELPVERLHSDIPLPGDELGAEALRSGQPQWSNQFELPETMTGVGPLHTFQGVRSVLVVPVTRDGKPIATVTIMASEENHFTAERISFLTAVSEGLGLLIENARLGEEIDVRRELEQRQNRFISIASHELRTPITTILGFAELLLRRDATQAQRREWLRIMARDARTVSALVDDLLDISRIQSGHMQVDLQPVDLAQTVHDSLEIVQLHLQGREISIKLPSDLPRALADSGRLEQVVVNLLDNALKYSPAGSPIEVKAHHDAPRDWLVLSVKDEGIGISKRDLSELFSPFGRVHSRETEGIRGTGLGLYIVRELLQFMNGTVWVESTPGKGSTFSFGIPTVPKPAISHA